MSKKVCELCSNPAKMFCDSDQASLCWDCDEKVHAANFLVAKHCRTLLCQVCSSPTPWKATGPKLGATVSVCHGCARRGGAAADAVDDADDEHAAAQNSDNVDADADREYYTTESDDFSEEDEDEDEDEEVEEEEDEEGENQVVPWSASASNSPPVTSSSGEEEDFSFSSSKRTRDSSEDEDGCCSSWDEDMSNEESEENYCSSPSRFLRPSKLRRGSGGSAVNPPVEPSLGTAAIVEKLRRFESDTSEMIMSLCQLTRD